MKMDNAAPLLLFPILLPPTERLEKLHTWEGNGFQEYFTEGGGGNMLVCL